MNAQIKKNRDHQCYKTRYLQKLSEKYSECYVYTYKKKS